MNSAIRANRLVGLFRNGSGRVSSTFGARRLNTASSGVLINATNGMNKVVSSSAEAIKDLKSGDRVMIGGFGICGIPENLIRAACARKEVNDLYVISNTAGTVDKGVGLLLQDHQVSSMVSSYIGENKTFMDQYMSGELCVYLTPQGNIVEKMRAAGAGIPGFYTPTGYGTPYHFGQIPALYSSDGINVLKWGDIHESRVMGGRNTILENELTADFGFVKAWKADVYGNLVFRRTAYNFNTTMARAARCTIAEVEEIVDAGELSPEEIDIPSVYVSKVVKGEFFEKPIERLALREEGSTKLTGWGNSPSRVRICKRAAREFRDGMNVNLGIGIPVNIPNFVDPKITVALESENGILGLGPNPISGEQDADLINAGKATCTIVKGGSVFDSEESFAMIRGSHLDITILGGMQVSADGDFANWAVPGKLVKGMGGAMDLVAANGTRCIVTMEHASKDGVSKIVPNCNLPLTGIRCVNRIITDLCVFDVVPGKGLVLMETAKGVSVDHVREMTLADFTVSDDFIPDSYE